MSKKEFDRSIAFTFYREWLETAQVIEEEHGTEAVAEYLLALANYALHKIEPQRKNGPLKLLWPQTKEKIDASQEHRARGFSKEDIELTDKIRKYKEEHPNESQDKIAQIIGCSKGKVNSALRATEALKDNTVTSTNTITDTSTSTGTTVTVTDEGLLDDYDLFGDIDSDIVLASKPPVSEELIKLTVLNNWKKGRNKLETARIVNEELGTSIDGDYVKTVFDAFSANENYKGFLESKVEEQDRTKKERERNLSLIDRVINPCRKAGISVSAEEVMQHYDERYGTLHSFTVDSLGRFISDNNWNERSTFADVIAEWNKQRTIELDYQFGCHEPPVRARKPKRRGIAKLEELACEDENEG